MGGPHGAGGRGALLLYMVHRVHEVTGQSGFGSMLINPAIPRPRRTSLPICPSSSPRQIGFWATLSLNMPNFTRFSKNQKSQMIGQALGLPTTMAFFSAIGVLITSATLVVYHEAIWDPTVLLAKPEFANPIVVIVSLLSIGIATLSVNVAANVVLPAFDFSNMWPEKIDFKIGGTITGVIGILMFPWKLLAIPGNPSHLAGRLFGAAGAHRGHHDRRLLALATAPVTGGPAISTQRRL